MAQSLDQFDRHQKCFLELNDDFLLLSFTVSSLAITKAILDNLDLRNYKLEWLNMKITWPKNSLFLLMSTYGPWETLWNSSSFWLIGKGLFLKFLATNQDLKLKFQVSKICWSPANSKKTHIWTSQSSFHRHKILYLGVKD